MSRRAQPDHQIPDKLVSREIQLGGADLVNVRKGLMRISGVLWDFASPDTVQKTAMEIPLSPLSDPDIENPTTKEWAAHNSLSLNYTRSEEGKNMSLSFTTPEGYDRIDVENIVDNGWLVKARRNPLLPTRQNIFTNHEVLRVLDSKLPHNPLFVDLLRRAQFLTDHEFPSELADTLQPFAKKRTEVKAYSAVERRTTPSFHVPSLNINTPEYTSDVIAEISRAEGVNAVDYSMRIAYSGLPVTADYTKHQSDNLGHVANVFEHGFRVPYGTDKIEDSSTTFTVIGTPNLQDAKMQRFVEDETVDERAIEHFRKGAQMILDKHGIIRPYDSEF